MSPERLARIDRMAQEAIADGVVPGLVALVARDGKIVYFKAFGEADNAAGRALERDDIFRIASQTKAITSTAVMMLWEEGYFSLDDPISKFIPAFKDPQVLDGFRYRDLSYTTVPADKEITIRHLLTHSSGLGYGFIDGDERMRLLYKQAGIVDTWTTDAVTLEDNINKLAQLPLHFNPGERFSYSEGLDVLGYLVEIVSGMPFDEFLRTRLFEPLGMNDTYFYLPADKIERLVPVQKPEDDHWVKYEGSEYYDADYPIKGARTYFSGGAGLCSTAHDYATFLQMYLNGGELNGIRFLSRTTVETIMSFQVPLGGEDSDSYQGLAFSVLNEKGRSSGGKGSEGTFTWGGYFNSQYFADPKEGVVGVILKQTREHTGDYTGDRFRQLVFQAIDD